MFLKISVAGAISLILTSTLQVTASASPATVTADAPSAASEEALPTVGRGFRWGVASSAFQTEGGELPSNWHRYADDGPGGNERYRNSVDFRHRYPDDIRRAAELGVNTYRISINWARVATPKPGEPARAALLRRCRAHDQSHGMQPVITLDHFVYPLWVLDQDAWDNPQTVADFVDFSRLIAHRYGDDVGWWLIFNEPFCYVATEIGARSMTPYQVSLMYDHLVQAHRRVYDVIHRVRPTARVSSNLCTPSLSAEARAAADTLFLDRVDDRIDFIGIDYYYYRDISVGLVTLMSGEIWKIPLDPEGIYHALVDYHQRYPSLPIVVTENGMSTDNGKPREDGWTRSGYLRDTVYWMQRALADGVPVQGYWYWSITDNYEWGSYRPRFGLFRVDVTTDPNLVRHPTDAVRTYRNLIARDGVATQYTPPEHPH